MFGYKRSRIPVDVMFKSLSVGVGSGVRDGRFHSVTWENLEATLFSVKFKPVSMVFHSVS